MNICSTCQGAQSECQERLDGNSEYRDARQRDARRPSTGLTYEKGITNKHFLWLMVEEIGLDKIGAMVKRPLTDLRVGPVLRLLHRAADRPAGDRRRAPARHVPAAADRDARRHRRRLRGPVQVLRLPDHHHEQGGVAQAGRAAPRRRGRRGRRLPRDAVPAVPPQPRPAAAARPSGSSGARSACRCCTCRRWSAWRSGSSRRSSGSASTSSSRRRSSIGPPRSSPASRTPRSALRLARRRRRGGPRLVRRRLAPPPPRERPRLRPARRRSTCARRRSCAPPRR